MPTFATNKLATWTDGTWSPLPGAAITGFNQDTRALSAGQVFVALKTDKRDGHDFLGEAKASGAAAALVGRQVVGQGIPQLVVADPLTAFQRIAREHRREFHGTVVGVTGSVGKTSTKDLLTRLLGGSPDVLATEGNLNNLIGVPLTLTRLAAAHRAAVIEEACSGDAALRARVEHMLATRIDTAVLPDMPTSAAALVGATLDGRYELRELLGQGGMGAVYRAWQRGLERQVAVKVIRTALLADADIRERFEREAHRGAAAADVASICEATSSRSTSCRATSA